ncbi:MAG: hypothetical protein MUE96_00365 [Bacteroidia bacterium]|jgi:hypothetical protein|nr:hypothetical protein [Bacteroidia bacterium]
MRQFILGILIVVLGLGLGGCEKHIEVVPQADILAPDSTHTKATLTLQVSHLAGSVPVGFNQQYVTTLDDSFRIQTLMYYLSNFELLYDTGAYLIPESYHLVDDLRPSSKQISHRQLPLGRVNGFTFLIGVDAERNFTGAQTGDLDPALGMFWTWVSGYIMAKMEGKFTKPNNPNATFIWHVGGFNPPYTGIRKVTFLLNEPKQLMAGDHINLRLNGDVLKWFDGVHALKIDSFPVFNNPSAFSNKVADNYQQMFSVDTFYVSSAK